MRESASLASNALLIIALLTPALTHIARTLPLPLLVFCVLCFKRVYFGLSCWVL